MFDMICAYARDPPRPCRGDSAGPYSDRGSESESIRIRNQDAADPHRDGGIADRHGRNDAGRQQWQGEVEPDRKQRPAEAVQHGQVAQV